MEMSCDGCREAEAEVDSAMKVGPGGAANLFGPPVGAARRIDGKMQGFVCQAVLASLVESRGHSQQCSWETNEGRGTMRLWWIEFWVRIRTAISFPWAGRCDDKAMAGNLGWLVHVAGILSGWAVILFAWLKINYHDDIDILLVVSSSSKLRLGFVINSVQRNKENTTSS